MILKEFRIPLPLTVEEYRIAQLYMIAKKSRDESSASDSGIEILVNEPYENGPGGNGQYTHKIYHLGSHLPTWLKGLLPKTALMTEEKAWNAYPYTKTIFTSPFLQRFSVEIETYYFPDGGERENVFNLSGSDLRNRVVDVIDVVKDQLHGADYVLEEDPRVYVSQRTGRGPITNENWIEEYKAECKGGKGKNGKAIMCAYKLCKVEFHFWGMQSKIEKYIQDIALRKTMLRAHRQAWCWQDEWFSLTMEDIREIEKQTQEALKKKMAALQRGEDYVDNESSCIKDDSPAGETSSSSSEQDSILPTSKVLTPTHATKKGNNSNTQVQSDDSLLPVQISVGSRTENKTNTTPESLNTLKTAKFKINVSDMSGEVVDSDNNSSTSVKNHSSTTTTLLQQQQNPSNSSISLNEPHRSKGGGSQTSLQSRASSKTTLNSPGSNSNKSFEIATWRMEALMRRDSDDEHDASDDEFFDAVDDDAVSLTKWSSLNLIPNDDTETNTQESGEKPDDSIFSQPYLKRMSERERGHKVFTSRATSVETSGSPVPSSVCSTTTLFLIFHAGSTLDGAIDLTAKKSDVTTFRGAVQSVMRQHYSSLMGHVCYKLVPCPSICMDSLGILSSLSPYSFDLYNGTGDAAQMTHESVPIGAIPLLATSQPSYWDAVVKTVQAANQVYQEFLKSEEGQGFSGNVMIIGDSMGSILCYDALTKHSATATEDEVPPSPGHRIDVDHLHANQPCRRRSSSSASDPGNTKLDFEVMDFFMFGAPLGLVLAHRKIQNIDEKVQLSRPCHQVYNLFHPTDPLSSRLEPLISARFASIPPVNIARYNKYPMGDGQPYHLLECIQSYPHAFSDSGLTSTPNCTRRLSDLSVQSGMSGLVDVLPLQLINVLTQKWWGSKRVDYALYCPEGLNNFPSNSLPHLFHASYWESTDAIAFMLRQIGFQDLTCLTTQEDKEVRLFALNRPREKWIKKRTSVKIKNVSANHRANDVIVRDGLPQQLRARFCYGPLDMVSLTGERVDIYVMKDSPGEWSQLATEVTDKNGRISYTIPAENGLGYGIHPVKMVVRGDHTSADFYLVVVPQNTECVVFSIDGSFTASMSVTGKDPRVRAGAVDVVRHYQELGYLIIYVTGRPCMQNRKVVSWLAQHNFPHGFVSFADGLSTDFLAHKADYLKNLVQEHRLIIHAAYGSAKDISVYTSVGLSPDKIYIVGKVPKKQQNQAIVLSEGYSTHFSHLNTHGVSRAAHGNARMVLPRTPGQRMSIRRKK